MTPWTHCRRAGEPLTEADIKYGHTWCRDCREVDTEMYVNTTGIKRKPANRVDIAEARLLHAQGLSNQQIAKRLKVAPSSIGKALKRAAA